MVKKIFVLGLLSVALIGLGTTAWSVGTIVPRLFQVNALRKAQGYSMGAFEFKMIDAQQRLNQGPYLDAYRLLTRIESEMEAPQHLVTVPTSSSPAAQHAFLLDRQNPETGAFIESYCQFFTYIAPTLNTVHHMVELSGKTSPLIKMPTSFLERIKTPEALRSYLDSLLYLNEWCSWLPGPGPYGPGVSELAYFKELESAGVYDFPQSWEDTLRQWFFETQDPDTGFWGARIGTPQHGRQKKDINSTYHILSLVLNGRGKNNDRRFPLRYAANLEKGILNDMGSPLPTDEAAQHDWGLCQNQGAGALTRRLWDHGTPQQQEDVRKAFLRILAELYRLYRPETGGFAYSRSDPQADVDGTSLALGVLWATGALPGTWERERLWGNHLRREPDRIHVEVPHPKEFSCSFDQTLQSVRMYAEKLPSEDGYDDEHPVRILYPHTSPHCDAMDLRQRVAAMRRSPKPSFGNWTSKTSLREIPLGLDRPMRDVPVEENGIDWDAVLNASPDINRYFLVAYDMAQIPRTVTEVIIGEACPND